jgi:acylphosphatase
MGLYRALQTMIFGPRTMAVVRLSGWTMLSRISDFYAIQNAAEGQEFTGWMMISAKGRLEAEFEGPQEELNQFVQNIAKGQITGTEVPLEHAWGTYQNRYPSLRIRLGEVVVHERPRSASNE